MSVLPSIPSILLSQRGALFGLDARISLAIFGALSIIAGAYSVLGVNSIHANSFAQELDETAKAIEAIHNDLEEDLHSSLDTLSDQNAFIALFDKHAIRPGRLRGKWLGPYINTNTSVHTRYGETRIVKRQAKFSESCVPEENCYLWLTYDTVPLDVAETLNETFDGNHEPGPDLQGVIQWQDGDSDRSRILWYRATRALRVTDFY